MSKIWRRGWSGGRRREAEGVGRGGAGGNGRGRGWTVLDENNGTIWCDMSEISRDPPLPSCPAFGQNPICGSLWRHTAQTQPARDQHATSCSYVCHSHLLMQSHYVHRSQAFIHSYFESVVRTHSSSGNTINNPKHKAPPADGQALSPSCQQVDSPTLCTFWTSRHASPVTQRESVTPIYNLVLQLLLLLDISVFLLAGVF